MSVVLVGCLKLASWLLIATCKESHAQKVQCFYMLLSQKGNCYAVAVNENSFPHLQCQTIVMLPITIIITYVKLSFIKYTCVSWLFSCELKLFVYDNAHFIVYCSNIYNLTDRMLINFFLNFIPSSLLWVPEECYCMSWTFLCWSCNIHQTMGFCASCTTFSSLFCCLPISYELQTMSNTPQIFIFRVNESSMVFTS
jgi:hypothetical protein